MTIMNSMVFDQISLERYKVLQYEITMLFVLYL